MESSASPAEAFHCFSFPKLPTELRLVIIDLALTARVRDRDDGRRQPGNPNRLAGWAVVNREWQKRVEAVLFASLRLRLFPREPRRLLYSATPGEFLSREGQVDVNNFRRVCIGTRTKVVRCIKLVLNYSQSSKKRNEQLLTRCLGAIFAHIRDWDRSSLGRELLLDLWLISSDSDDDDDDDNGFVRMSWRTEEHERGLMECDFSEIPQASVVGKLFIFPSASYDGEWS